MHDLPILATALERNFPHLVPFGALTILGEGFGSVVIETASGLVFRLPKNHLARRGHERERDTLPILARYLPAFNLPVPAYTLAPSADFPHGLSGYRKLPGRPLAPADITPETIEPIAAQVATFLRALHAIPLAAFATLALPPYPPPPAELNTTWRRAAAYLAPRLPAASFSRLRARWDELRRQIAAHTDGPVPLHGDPWYENFLYDPQRLRITGILDFEALALGYPLTDLAVQSYLGNPFLRAVARHCYAPAPPPADLAHRVRSLLLLREMLGLDYGLTTGTVDPDTLGKIAALVRDDGAGSAAALSEAAPRRS